MYIPKGLKFGQILSKFAKLIAFMEGLQTCFAKERSRVGANPLSCHLQAQCEYRCAKQLKTRKNCLEIAPCLRLSGVPLSRFYLELAVFSVFFTQTEQILLFHLVNWTCGVRSATVASLSTTVCAHMMLQLQHKQEIGQSDSFSRGPQHHFKKKKVQQYAVRPNEEKQSSQQGQKKSCKCLGCSTFAWS